MLKTLFTLLALFSSLASAAPVTPFQGGTGAANVNAATLTRSGAHALTLTTVGVTSLTLPTTGTLAILGANTFTGAQTMQSTLAVTGAVSGAGASFTTGAFSSAITVTTTDGDGLFVKDSGTFGTSATPAIRLYDTANGTTQVAIGLLSPASGAFSIFSTVSAGTNAGEIWIRPSSTTVGAFSSTGLAVTGTLAVTGAVSGAAATFTAIAASGGYTQSGTGANTFTGTPTFSNATYSALFTGGSVGVGTATPGRKLHVYNDAMRIERPGVAADLALIELYRAGSEKWGIELDAVDALRFYAAGAYTAPAVTILNTSNVGIGLTDPSAARLVVGETANTSAFKYTSFYSNAIESGSITRVGVTAAVTFNTTSDGDLKNVFGDADRQAASARIMAYRMKDYEFKSYAGLRFVGPVAQDTYTVNRDPMLVTPGTDKSAWQINMSGFIPDLIMHVQNLQAQVDELAGGKVLASKPPVLTLAQIAKMEKDFSPVQAASNKARIARTAYEDKSRADHKAAAEKAEKERGAP